MKCDVDSACQTEASHTFVWPWGTPGACCPGHIVVVQQRARATRGRQGVVNFVPLDPHAPKAPITRDERITLHAARMTAESERDDARKSAVELRRVNEELSTELRQLRVRVTQFQAEVKALGEQVEAAYKERDAALLRVADMQEECERLGVRTRPTPPDPIPAPVSRSYPGQAPFVTATPQKSPLDR
jgi:hypothetical protein